MSIRSAARQGQRLPRRVRESVVGCLYALGCLKRALPRAWPRTD